MTDDPRECGWLGCGHPKCARLCAAVPLDEWREWKDGVQSSAEQAEG